MKIIPHDVQNFVRAGVSVSISATDYIPADVQAILAIAKGSGSRITLRDAAHYQSIPVLQQLCQVGGNVLAVEL